MLGCSVETDQPSAPSHAGASTGGVESLPAPALGGRQRAAGSVGVDEGGCLGRAELTTSQHAGEAEAINVWADERLERELYLRWTGGSR